MANFKEIDDILTPAGKVLAFDALNYILARPNKKMEIPVEHFQREIKLLRGEIIEEFEQMMDDPEVLIDPFSIMMCLPTKEKRVPIFDNVKVDNDLVTIILSDEYMKNIEGNNKYVLENYCNLQRKVFVTTL